MGASTAWETPTLPAGQGARAAAAAAPCKGTSGGTAGHGASQERMGTGGATATTPGRAASAGAVQQGRGGANGAPPPPGCSEAFTSRGDLGRSGCSLRCAEVTAWAQGSKPQSPGGLVQGRAAPPAASRSATAWPWLQGPEHEAPVPVPVPIPPARSPRLPLPSGEVPARLSPRGRRVLSRVAGAWLPPSRR